MQYLIRFIAIYARYSTSMQKETSIEDQIARCLKTAEANNLKVIKEYIYHDDAISGSYGKKLKRTEYQRLIQDIEAGKIDTLIIDDISRLARDTSEGVRFREYVAKGLRIISNCGVDTTSKNWKALWNIKFVFAEQQLDTNGEQVIRGLVGQLNRGFQIAQPPFGYRRKRIINPDNDNIIGTKWEIVDEKVEIVKKIFDLRINGTSLVNIAKYLNDEKVPTARPDWSKKKKYWQPFNIAQLLKNEIYKGRFIWNGSVHSRLKAERQRTEYKPVSYDREYLRIVSNEVWSTCNPKIRQRKLRGGIKHPLSGLIECGDCGNRLSGNFGGKSPTLSCKSCVEAFHVGVSQNPPTYSSFSAASLALESCIKEVFSAEMKIAFTARLKEKLEKPDNEVEKSLIRQRDQAKTLLERTKQLAMLSTLQEVDFTTELVKASRDYLRLDEELRLIQCNRPVIVEADVTKQLNCDPLDIVHELLHGESIEPASVRVRLQGLIQKFVLMPRPSPRASQFEISFVPGLFIGQHTVTTTIDTTVISYVVDTNWNAKLRKFEASLVKKECSLNLPAVVD